MERLKAHVELFVIIIFTVLLWWAGIASAAEPEDDIKPEFNITTTTLIVHWYNTERELQLSLQDNDIAGFSECELRPDFNTSFCEMWLVTPVNLCDDYAFDTIGHELYHALAGNFHDTLSATNCIVR